MKESQEFKERKALIELQKEADLYKHKLKMIQLTYERESSKILHDQILEKMRIQRAEYIKQWKEKQSYYNNRYNNKKGE